MERFESALLAIDFTPATEVVVRRGLWLAGQPGLHRLHLLHVIDARLLDGIAAFAQGQRARLESDARAAAEQSLAALAQRFRRAGACEVTTECRLGRPDDELIAAIAQHAPALIVAGAGNRAWRQLLLGSTARRLLRRVDRPIWLVRDDDENETQLCTRVLLASDLGPSAAAVARIVAAYWPQAEIEILHVQLDVPALAEGLGLSAGADSAAMQARVEPQALARLADFSRANLPGALVVTRLERGHPAGVVLGRVQAWQPQLLALGRSGRDRLESVLLGSVTEALVDLVDCDLLIAPVAMGDSAAVQDPT